MERPISLLSTLIASRDHTALRKKRSEWCKDKDSEPWYGRLLRDDSKRNEAIHIIFSKAEFAATKDAE